MAEIKSSSQSHKTGTFRGAVWADETIPLLPLCQVTIMCNKDKWLALTEKKSACSTKLLHMSGATQIQTAPGVLVSFHSTSGWRRLCRRREKKAESGKVRSLSKAPGSTFELMAPLQLCLQPASTLQGLPRSYLMKTWWSSSLSLPPFNLTPPRLSAGTPERRLGS